MTTPINLEETKAKIVAMLKTIYDPEIPVNIYEMGMIYDIDIKEDGAAHINMTLTSPSCPVAETLPPEVENKLRAVPGVTSGKVAVVWDPPWNKDMMSEAAKLELNLM